LGSSAAIVVASLGALFVQRTGETDDAGIREAVLDRALSAHRQAQGGGSGIDVAASAWGGFIVARRAAGSLSVEPIPAPPLHIEVWACASPASTAEFLSKVRALGTSEPSKHREIMARLTEAAESAERAARSRQQQPLIDALAVQRDGLDALGQAARIPIFTEEVRVLAALAEAEGAVVMPAGAGGGDIATYFGREPPSEALVRAARGEGLTPLEVTLGARGVHVT
jgi:phosphomevalonate kinase